MSCKLRAIVKLKNCNIVKLKVTAYSLVFTKTVTAYYD